MKFNPQVIDAYSPSDFDSFLRQYFRDLHPRDIRFRRPNLLTLRPDAVLELLGTTQSQLVNLIRGGRLSRPFADLSGHLVWLQKEIEPLMSRAPKTQRRIGFLGKS